MLSAILFGGLVIWGMFFLWPLKKEIYKKNGRILSNDEIFKLAENGDPDAIRLRKRTKYFLAYGIISGLLIVLEKYHFITI